MKDRKLATRYARALLSALPDKTQAESADRFLGGLARIMAESDELREVLLDPFYNDASRTKVLLALAQQDGQPKPIQNFVRTLVDNRRCSSIPSIARTFHAEREQAMGIVPVEMTTATPIDDTTRQRAGEALEKMTGRSVRLTCSVDTKLLGGAVTRIGSTVYDGSLRTQLGELRRRMAQE